jgi:hypothetical protein
MTEIEIWRAAYLMLRWYGETAQQESARRADEFVTAADADGAASWHRVIDAIDQLASRTPPGPVHCAAAPPPRLLPPAATLPHASAQLADRWRLARSSAFC